MAGDDFVSEEDFEVPGAFVVLRGVNHSIAPDEPDRLDANGVLGRTGCGILFDADTPIEEESSKYCGVCSRVIHLYYIIKFQGTVVDAAIKWEEDPDSGPLRGALSEALAQYRRFWDFHA